MFRRILSALAVAALATGCATPLGVAILKMPTERPLDDRSALAPDLAQKHYQRLIVVPPPARDPKAVDLEPIARLVGELARHPPKDATPPPEWPSPASAAAEMERGLLKEGVGLVSPDVAGKAAAAAKHATRAERLLALGKETGADAILELVNVEWRHHVVGRWFLYDEERNAFDEIDELRYDTTEGRRWWARGTQLELAARLLDAQTGAVEAEFDLSCNGLWNLPAVYEETIEVYEHGLKHRKDNYQLSTVEENGRRACLARATQRIAGALGARPVEQK